MSRRYREYELVWVKGTGEWGFVFDVKVDKISDNNVRVRYMVDIDNEIREFTKKELQAVPIGFEDYPMIHYKDYYIGDDRILTMCVRIEGGMATAPRNSILCGGVGYALRCPEDAPFHDPELARKIAKRRARVNPLMTFDITRGDVPLDNSIVEAIMDSYSRRIASDIDSYIDRGL